MNELKGGTGELRMSVTIKRAATGKEEHYELVGSATDEQAAALGLDPGRAHGASGAVVGQGAKLSNED